MNQHSSPSSESPALKGWKTILILGILTAYVPFSIDSYLPALTHLAGYFGTTAAKMTFSLSTFFIGFATGQILYGPLLDRYGRKNPLYVGVAISVLASVGCIFSWDAGSFIAFRFLQALGASVASVSALAMVRDFFPPSESSRVFSLLVLVIGSSPLLAPTLGGYITAHLGWQWIFVFLMGMAAVLVSLVRYVLPVRYVPRKESKLRLSVLARDYWDILKHPQFLTYSLAGAFSFSSLFIYVAGSPIIFMEKYGMSAQSFGILFALLSVGFIGGSQLNIQLLKRIKSRIIFRFALMCQLSIALLFSIGMWNDWYGRDLVSLFLFLILLSLGFTSPNGMALSLAPIEKNLGSASALLGTIRIGIAGLTSGGIALLNVTNGVPVAVMMLVTAGISFVIHAIGRRHIVRFAAAS
ncbi:MAG: multidrug effflux MFS transporter [Bacteroidales bacterium]